jgi:hypothetical protein
MDGVCAWVQVCPHVSGWVGGMYDGRGGGDAWVRASACRWGGWGGESVVRW